MGDMGTSERADKLLLLPRDPSLLTSALLTSACWGELRREDKRVWDKGRISSRQKLVLVIQIKYKHNVLLITVSKPAFVTQF